MARISFARLILAAGTVLALAIGSLPAHAEEDPNVGAGRRSRYPIADLGGLRGRIRMRHGPRPLDYRRPAGGTIPLAVIRRQVADPARRDGNAVPSAWRTGQLRSQLSSATVMRTYRSELRERFDVFGFDVRGVGLSGQLQCWDDAEYSRAVSNALGRPVASDRVQAGGPSGQGLRCCLHENAADLLPYVGTGYVARDIDLLRQALGERQLTFYGRSFGTYIGTVYADLFPDRVRAMVLDGGYDPRRYANRPYKYDRTQYLALDAALERFFTWCVAHAHACARSETAVLGQRSSNSPVRSTRAPVPIPGQGVANGYTLAYRLMFNINGGKVAWPDLADRSATSTTTRQQLLPAAPAIAGLLRLPHRQRGWSSASTAPTRAAASG